MRRDQNEDHLNAATMKSVLEALEQKLDEVTVSYRLTLRQGSQEYCVEKTSRLDMPIRGVENTETFTIPGRALHLHFNTGGHAMTPFTFREDTMQAKPDVNKMPIRACMRSQSLLSR